MQFPSENDSRSGKMTTQAPVSWFSPSLPYPSAQKMLPMDGVSPPSGTLFFLPSEMPPHVPTFACLKQPPSPLISGCSGRPSPTFSRHLRRTILVDFSPCWLPLGPFVSTLVSVPPPYLLPLSSFHYVRRRSPEVSFSLFASWSSPHNPGDKYTSERWVFSSIDTFSPPLLTNGQTYDRCPSSPATVRPCPASLSIRWPPPSRGKTALWTTRPPRTPSLPTLAIPSNVPLDT